MPKGYRREDHFDQFEAIGRNPFYKPQPDGSLRHETELIVDRGIEFIQSQAVIDQLGIFRACQRRF